MSDKSNKKLTVFSQQLRSNMTKEERRLWYDFLKNLPVTVNRQKVIGKYIVDFYCSQARIVVELDGSQHYEEYGIEKDRERDRYLSDLGISVLRYSNHEINTKFQSVCDDIWHHIFGEQEM